MGMPRIGLITNPRAGTHRRLPRLAMLLTARAGREAHVEIPEDLTALSASVRRLRDRDVDLLFVSGGDGTLHRVLTAMLPVWGSDPLPELVPLPSGTMNIVARSVGVRGRSDAVLEAVLEDRRLGRPGRRCTRSVLRFEGDDFGPAWGFLSGNGLIARFLDRYYEGRAGALRAALLLGHAMGSALRGGSFAADLTAPWEGRITLDGTPWGARERWTAVAIGTIEHMGLGARPFHAVRPGHLHLIGIGGSTADLARDLPRIVRGLGPARPGNLEAVGRSVGLHSADTQRFMIDGDFYRAGPELRVTVDREIRFVVPERP